MENINPKHKHDHDFESLKVSNDKLDRSALAVTLRPGEAIEFSNGVTFIYRYRKSSDSILVLMIAPKEVEIHSECFKKRISDGKTS